MQSANQDPAQLVAAGNALRVRGDAPGAVSLYRAAIGVDPNHFEACNNLGVILTLSGRLDEAASLLQRAVARKPQVAHAWANLGNTLMQSGDVAKAVAASRRAVELKPDSAGARSNLVFFLTFDPTASEARIFEEHRRWSQIHADPLLPSRPLHTNDRSSGRRLRIGYVSPDFRDHAVAYFIEPILAGHDPKAVEVFCYSNVERPDAVTARLRGLVSQWKDIGRLTDDEAAALIRTDQIDILIDLAGYTSGGRLLVFARKPAPVQVAYLGYPNTTGMRAMDYRIIDYQTDPIGQTESLWTEKLIRMPRTFACYRPPAAAPEPGPLPSIAAGHITFGSFAMLAKLNEPLIESWSTIMRSLPGSRLLMAAGGLQESAIRSRVTVMFAKQGIDGSRLQFEGNLKFNDYLQAHRRIDILLDPFPVNGHTVSCHALWMGVPMISLAGSSYRQRLGASLLHNLGLPELAANSIEDYQTKAIELARDANRLGELRSSLRERMRNSPICDARGFVDEIEASYQTIWKHWCEQT